MKALKKIFPILFFITAAANVYANYTAHELIGLITKPLITCLLVLIYLSAVKKPNFWVVSALFFSFWGDVLLLFQEQYFVFGLASFLIAHLLYITATSRYLQKVSPAGILMSSLPFILILVGLIWKIYPGLNEMLIPVVVYGIVISTFGVVSLLIYKKERSTENLWLLLGAFTFILSDSILAMNKFDEPIVHSGVLIMTTYILAQFLLCKAFIAKEQ